MKMISYKKALMMDKDAINRAMIPISVRIAEMEAQLAKLKIERKKAATEILLEQACHAKNIAFSHIITLMNEVDLFDRQIRQFDQIVKEMFPAETPTPTPQRSTQGDNTQPSRKLRS